MSRERVIVDIENLKQALKLEQTVRTGYCDPIAENLLAWIAVEEDLAGSYEKLSERESKQDLKNAMKDLAVESRNNAVLLQQLLNSVDEFGKARDQRQRLIKSLISQKPDQPAI